MTPTVRHCRAWLSLWLMTCVPFLRAKVQQKFALSWHSWERRLWKILGSKGSAKNCTSVSPPLSWGSFFLWALSQIMTFPHISIVPLWGEGNTLYQTTNNFANLIWVISTIHKKIIKKKSFIDQFLWQIQSRSIFLICLNNSFNYVKLEIKYF